MTDFSGHTVLVTGAAGSTARSCAGARTSEVDQLTDVRMATVFPGRGDGVDRFLDRLAAFGG